MKLWATTMERGVLLCHLINPRVSLNGIHFADITLIGRSIQSVILTFALPDLQAEDKRSVVGQALVQHSIYSKAHLPGVRLHRLSRADAAYFSLSSGGSHAVSALSWHSVWPRSGSHGTYVARQMERSFQHRKGQACPFRATH